MTTVYMEETKNVITELQPVSVQAPIEAISSCGEDSANLEVKAAPVISREGMRKNKGNTPASMISHRMRRKKKSKEQVEYLRQLYITLGGEWDGKMRKEAM